MSTSTPRPYAASAPQYFRNGFTDAIPLKQAPDSKLPGVKGFTGYDGKPVGFAQMTEWCNGLLGSRNVGLRMPANVAGVDVDHGYRGKVGMVAFQKAQGKLGKLPDTWTSTSRGEAQPSRIGLYRLPVGKVVRKGAEKAFNEAFGEDVDIIHRTWRHVVACPSLHPDTGEVYRWYAPDGTLSVEFPRVADLPELPESWVAFLCDEPTIEADGKAHVTHSDKDASYFPRVAERMMAQQLDKIRSMDEHSKVRSVIGGAARLFNHFVLGGVLTREDAVGQLMAAVRENDWHSDEWNKANRDWTAEPLIVSTFDQHTDDAKWTLKAERARREVDPDNRLYTDAALAGDVSEALLRDRFLFTKGLGWLRWTGKLWEAVESEIVRDEIRLYVLSEFARAADDLRQASMAQDKGLQSDAEARVAGWLSAQSKNKLDAMVSLATGIVTEKAENFDLNDDLLNCPNGIVNLRTGAILEHDPALLMTKMTAVDYVPGACDPSFKAALQAVPPAVEPWLQVRLGQAITGSIPDDGRFVILTGDGENGKTTLMNAVFDCLTPESQMNAGYGRQVVSELLLKSKGDGSAPSPAKMTLMGTRLAYFEETPEGRHLDANVVKKLMDTPKVTARHLFKDLVTFGASHSMFLNTNYVPAVAETDHGTWRRLCRVDFPYRFVNENKPVLEEGERYGDATLKAKLSTTEAREAALAWLVDGAIRFYAKGTLRAFEDPQEVAESTRAWRMKSDQILDFFEGRFVYGAKAKGSFVDRKSVYDLYVQYCEENHYSVPNMATFLARVESHSVVRGVREVRVASGSAGHSLPPMSPSQVWSGAQKCAPVSDADGRIRALTNLKFA